MSMKRVDVWAPMNRPTNAPHYRTFNDPKSYGQLDLALRRIGNSEFAEARRVAEELILDYCTVPENEEHARTIMANRKKRDVEPNEGEPLDMPAIGGIAVKIDRDVFTNAATLWKMQPEDAEVQYTPEEYAALLHTIDPEVYAEIMYWSTEVQQDITDPKPSGVDTSD